MIKNRKYCQKLLLSLIAFTLFNLIFSAKDLFASGSHSQNSLESPNNHINSRQNMTEVKKKNLNSEKKIIASFPAFDTSKTNEEIFANNLPRNFRDLSETEAKISAIASGQFSEEELLAVKQKYPKDKIIIVDLRSESHIFINGKPVLWRSEFDSANVGKNASQITADEQNKIKQITNAKKIIVADNLVKDEKSGWYSSLSPVVIDVKNAVSEQDLAKELGFGYIRIPVRDHSPPSQLQLNQMVSLIKNTPETTKIYVHCAGGKGRTTTFLAVMDILKNVKNNSFEEIIKRQHKANGANLEKLDQESEWRLKLAEQRIDLLKNFYQKELLKANMVQ